MTLDLNIWWSVPQFAPRIVLVLQMSILSRYLVMMKSIICPCRKRGCVQVVLCASFCLNMVLVTIRSNSVHSANRSSPLELHSRCHICPWLWATCHFLFLSLHWSILSAGACRYWGCFWVYHLADCRMSPCSLRGSLSRSICTDYCSIPVLCQRDSHSHNPVTHWMWHFCQLCHHVPFYWKAYSSFSPPTIWLATPIDGILQIV